MMIIISIIIIDIIIIIIIIITIVIAPRGRRGLPAQARRLATPGRRNLGRSRIRCILSLWLSDMALLIHSQVYTQSISYYWISQVYRQ